MDDPVLSIRVTKRVRGWVPDLPIIARAHSEEEIDYLRRHGASVVVMGEHEIAKAMLDTVAEIQTMVEQAVGTRPERATEADLEEKPAVS